ncbi:unnamed protein product [Rotaria magnacalcarata]
MLIKLLCIVYTLFVSICSEQLQAPIILRESSDGEVPLGSRKVFTCNAIGYPPPTYMWLREWQNLTSNFSSFSYFEITSAKKQDQGSYRCLAKNDVGIVASKTTHLTIWYFDGFTSNQRDQFVSISESDAVVLQLPTISSSPEPTVQWFMKSSSLSRDNKPIIMNEKYFITSTYNLVILNTDYQDEKIYFAIIENIFVGGTKQSPDFRLEINRRKNSYRTSSLEFIIKPTDQLATIGNHIKSFECIANAGSGNPIETIWQKDAVLIDSTSGRFHIGPYNRTLEVRGIIADDQGTYSCHVRIRNTDSYINASAKLTVRGVPIITTNFPLIQNVDLQDKIIFSCNGTQTLTNYNVTWYKDAVRLINQSSKVQLIENKLVINDIEWNDQGMYQCFLTNDVGEDTRSTWLRIKSEPPTVTVSNDLIVFNGTDIQLTCTANGSPWPNITWFKLNLNDDERILLNNMNGKFHVDKRTGVLSVLNTMRNDSGIFECLAQNILGSAHARTTLLVRRRTRIISLPQTMKIIKAQSLVLVCHVFSEDDVAKKISWYFNHNQMISQNRVYNESTILIDTPQNEDTGNYTCKVESEAGNDTRTTEVTVIELPWPPTFVRASLVNDSTSKSIVVNLTWIPNFDGNMPIERYIIQMKDCTLSDISEFSSSYDELGWETKDDINIQRSATKTWTVISGLRPFTTYRFRLSARNQLGEGQISDPSNKITLPEEIPSGTVKSVTAIPRDSTSVFIEYSKPIESIINGQLIGYDIKYALNYPNPNWKSIRVNSSTQSYILKDLMTWESYLISVSLVNNVGIGPASENVKVRTLEGIPSRAPTLIQYEPMNSTAIMIKWQGPSSSYINGILNSFKIELIDLKRNITLYQEQQAKPIELYQFVIGSLKKFTNYSVRINCATKIGSGPWSSPTIFVRTHEDVPDQVENLTFSNVYDTSLDISWQKPSEINGHLIGYELEWYQINNTQSNLYDRSVIEIEPHLTTYKINNLSATTCYTISVRAKTRKGFGLKRSASIESGYPPEMPSPPTNMEIISIEKRSVTIKFSPGYTGKTNILRYIVQIQMRSNNSQWENTQSFHIEQSKLIVRDLYPNRSYRIRMSAVNIKGTSNASIPTEFFRTKPDVPSSVPQLLLAQAINSSAIRVRWMPIATNEWNSGGKDVGYIISINDSVSRVIKIEDPLTMEFTFNDLSPAHTLFLIRLHTYNRIGMSKISIETTEKTFESVPLRSPSNIHIDSINGTSVTIRWDSLNPRDQGGLITNYKIMYYALSSPRVIHTIDYSDNSSSISYILNNLDGYNNYSCSICVCTSTGCSSYSPAFEFRTDESVPSKPTEVFFSNVGYSSAYMTWQKPTKLNGILIGYKIVYWGLDDEQTQSEIDDLTSATNSYSFKELEKTTPYTFILCAKTRIGCGEKSINRLLTMENRERPDAPLPPTIIESSINATSLILTWRKDGDFNYAPIRYIFIEYQEEHSTTWKPYDPINKPDGQITKLLVQNLKPNTKYRFRLASQNDMGISDYSRSTNFVRTKESAPLIQLTINYILTTQPCQIDIYLKELDSIDNNTRLKVLMKSVSNEETFQTSYHSINEDYSIHLDNLCQNSNINETHVLHVCLSNAVGDGPLSFARYFHIQSPAPLNISINSMNVSVLSPREILVRWNISQILSSINYRIRWAAANETDKEKSLIASYNESMVILDNLTPFTTYKIMINIFNINGDGLLYETDVVGTYEDVPGPMDQLTFSYVTFTSLQIEWQAPKSLNGILRSYELTYDNHLSFPSLMNTSSTRVKTIKQLLSPNITLLRIDELDSYQSYEFSLCACTIQCGPCIHKSIQTGPQKLAPLPPFDLFINKRSELIWKSSIKSEYYLVELSHDHGHTWKFIDQTFKSPLNLAKFQLNDSIEYYFRIYSVNRIGISEPSQIYRHNFTIFSTSFPLINPLQFVSNIFTFTRTNPLFFYIILGLVLLLIFMVICIVITCCCCRMKLKKTKLLQSTNTLSSNLNTAESKQSLYTSTTLLTPIKKELIIHRNRDSLALSDLIYNNFSSRSPPRPIPTPTVYDDLNSTKSLLTNNNNASNHSIDETQSKTDYSWYHALPQQLYTYMTNNHLTNRIMEENEHDSDEIDLAVAFSGAILMNNVPRSRAAVNGCSSFAL